ncbi:MAG: glycosyltransferase family 39 protein, partial [Rhodospirillaceae bacterium]|nr:glycosyltransferase family 39 protein [Rhodospirillaceae bacterium]
QGLSLGYRVRHPPLMTWLTWAVIEATGSLWFATHALKAVLLAGGFLAYFAAARRLLGATWPAALATVSTTGLFAVGWKAQVSLSHTVLLIATMSLTLWAMLRAVQRGGWGDYALFGLAFALGLISKFYFAAFGLGLIAAVLAVPEYRKAIRWERAALSLFVAVLVTAPPVAWTLDHWDAAMAAAHASMASEGFDPVTSLYGFVGALLLFTLPVSVLWVLLWPSASGLWAPLPAPLSQARRFLIVLMGTAALLFGATLTLAGATNSLSRWLHPVLLWAPMLVALAVQARPPGRGRVAGYLLSLAILALVFAVARPVRYFDVPDGVCLLCRHHVPYPALAEEIAAGTGFRGGTMVASDHFIGGNLRPRFGVDASILTVGYPLDVFPPSRGDGDCLAVWRPDPLDPTDTTPPAGLVWMLTDGLGVDPEALDAAPRQTVSAPILQAPRQTYTLATLYIPGGSGACR